MSSSCDQLLFKQILHASVLFTCSGLIKVACTRCVDWLRIAYVQSHDLISVTRYATSLEIIIVKPLDVYVL